MKPRVFKPLPTGVARAAKGRFPFPGHRTCDQWMKPVDPDAPKMVRTDADRREDAKRGSARLKDAIERAAA
jgi:hypothetical protein